MKTKFLILKIWGLPCGSEDFGLHFISVFQTNFEKIIRHIPKPKAAKYQAI